MQQNTYGQTPAPGPYGAFPPMDPYAGVNALSPFSGTATSNTHQAGLFGDVPSQFNGLNPASSDFVPSGAHHSPLKDKSQVVSPLPPATTSAMPPAGPWGPPPTGNASPSEYSPALGHVPGMRQHLPLNRAVGSTTDALGQVSNESPTLSHGSHLGYGAGRSGRRDSPTSAGAFSQVPPPAMQSLQQNTRRPSFGPLDLHYNCFNLKRN